ncbi:MAG: dual specificity protein phosphatase family protein [Spirochaetes bacterium]|nr:dual specificity protein phosphatase family protein [Spirochaetota bacterium]
MNFCFVLDDLLSASSQPGKNRRIQDYLQLYRENNIRVLLSLYKRLDLPADWGEEFLTYHLKITDFEAPSLDMLDRIVDQIIVHLRKKEAVNVNCAAGISHSGLVCTAVLMKYLELDSATAHAKVAEQRGALEDEEHLARLREYERFLARRATDLRTAP